jgi:hypothetical protein
MKIDDIITVLRAAKEGKPLEFKPLPRIDPLCQYDWQDAPSPSWDFSTKEYRVKPEPPKPREFWICCNGTDQEGRPLDALIYPRAPICNRTVIHLREVVDAPSVSNGSEDS